MGMRNLANLLRAVAEFNGYPERIAQWESRFAVNAPELELFFAAPEPTAPAIADLPAVVPVALRDGDAFVAPPDSITAIAERVSRGEVKAADLVSQALAAARANTHLHAFITLCGNDACAAAERVDRMAAVGEMREPLAGIPVAIKDLMQVAGVPLTGGSRALPGIAPAQDADAVMRLRIAGAAIIGTANLHELAYGITSDNPHFGRVVNPRAPDHIPGGSSGGSAAAVAAGIVRAAVGTDTAGSIRIPAACCGVVGFKPGYDAVSRSGVMNLTASLDHVGPIAATVAGAAGLFAAMAGIDMHSLLHRNDLQGVGVVRPIGPFFELLDPAVKKAVDDAVGGMAGDGATVGDVEIPGVELAPAIQFVTICCEATQEHWTLLKTHADGLGPDVRTRLEIGQFLLGKDYVKAQRMRTQFRNRLLTAFGDADVMALPTLRTPAPAVGEHTLTIGNAQLPLHTAMTNLTLLFNLSGLPAITLPCGITAGGLPIALQLAARPGAELKLLAIAQRCETLLGAVKESKR
jgi:aspartyl-tRNA(Asn)/glutamyl-tRNA(Gln) amidotransferase subunit A